MQTNYVLRFPLEIILIIVEELVNLDAFDAITSLAKMKNPVIQSALNSHILTIVCEDILFDYYQDFFQINQFKPEYTISQTKIKLDIMKSTNPEEDEKFGDITVFQKKNLRDAIMRSVDTPVLSNPPSRNDCICYETRTTEFFYELVDNFQSVFEKYKMIHFEIYTLNSNKTCVKCDIERCLVWLIHQLARYFLLPLSESTERFFHISVFKPIHQNMGETILYKEGIHPFHLKPGHIDSLESVIYLKHNGDIASPSEMPRNTLFDYYVEKEFRLKQDENELFVHCPRARKPLFYDDMISALDDNTISQVYGLRSEIYTYDSICISRNESFDMICSGIKTVDIIAFAPERNLSLTDRLCTYDSIYKLEKALRSVKSYYNKIPIENVDFYRSKNIYLLRQDKARLMMRMICNYIVLKRQDRKDANSGSTEDDNTYYQVARFRVYTPIKGFLL